MRRIYQSDLVLHEPLPWSLYDEMGNLLLREGFTLTSERHITSLVDRGAYVQLQLEAEPEEAPRIELSGLTRLRQRQTSVFSQAHELAQVLEQFHAQLQDGVVPYNMVQVVREMAHQIVDACTADADALLAALHLERELPYLVTQQLLGACLAEMVARELKWDDSMRTSLACAALSRDISLLPEQAQLDKQESPLTLPQQRWIFGHTQRSVALLQQMGVRDSVWLQCVQQHHERTDGSGYPQRLEGKEIAEGARLLGITDSYAAMVTPRRNRTGMFTQEALKLLFEQRNSRYDEHFLRTTVQTLTLHPPGTFARLANGETAVVRKRSKSNQPMDLWCLYDHQGMALPHPQPRNPTQPEHKITGTLRVEDCRSVAHTLKSLWAKA